jgi:hypothetical protein
MSHSLSYLNSSEAICLPILEYEELKKLNKKSTNKDIIETMKKINEVNASLHNCYNSKSTSSSAWK